MKQKTNALRIITITVIFGAAQVHATSPGRIERGLNALGATASIVSLLDEILGGSIPVNSIQPVADIASIITSVIAATQKEDENLLTRSTAKKDISFLQGELERYRKDFAPVFKVAFNSIGLAASLYSTAKFLTSHNATSFVMLRMSINILQVSLRATRLYHLTR